MSRQPNMKRKEPQSDASQNGQEGHNLQLQHQSIKRQRDDDEDDNKGAKEPTPTYGTKEYWEARYKSHNLPAEVTVNENSYVLDGVLLSKDALRAGHEWYFTYDELRPILLPLILGKLDNEVDASDYNNNDDDAESWIEEEEDDADEVEEYEEDDQEDENHSEEDNIDDNKQSTCCEKESEHENAQKDTEDDTHADKQEHYQADTSIKPKRVLEIGCGDKPLGTALVSDLLSMQLSMVVGQVTCIDYSEVVVKSLIEQQKKEEREQDHNCSTSAKDEDAQHESSDTNQLKPNFQALDARSLPFESNTWDLILEKGTLDAMLSDDNEGVHNCIKIVKEMARLTSEGGAILIVSHLNANEPKGMGWLEDVVFCGLKNEFMERRRKGKEKMKSNNNGKSEEDEKKEYVWSVEVHGGEGKFLDVNGDEIENPDNDAIQIYGPAVYVIRKKSVPASVALDLFGKKKEDEEKDKAGEEGMKEVSDEDISHEEKELMEMPPVKLEFISY